MAQRCLGYPQKEVLERILKDASRESGIPKEKLVAEFVPGTLMVLVSLKDGGDIILPPDK